LISVKKIEFYKYHALGNDFLIIDFMKKSFRSLDPSRLAQQICHRQFGIGADGILILTRSRKADCSAELYNSDGSWAEKSGNGLRMVAAHIYTRHSRRKRLNTIMGGETAVAEIVKARKTHFMIRVSLGRPVLEAKKVPMKSRSRYHINSPIKIDKREFPVTALAVGNPHTVLFVDNFDFEWRELGRIIENCRYFPRRTNVEFVKVVNRSRVILNDWERGAGATGSSGTGAAAAVVAGVINGYLKRQVKVVFPSGSLLIDWSEINDNIYLTGPVELVGRGEFLFKAGKPA
jgi:diaminopimelate epimerase